MELLGDTFWMIGKTVRQVMEEKGKTAHEAASYMQKALTDKQALALMRGPFGLQALKEAEREILRGESGERAPLPPLPNAGRNRLREMVQADPWGIMVAVEGFGRVPLGEMTPAHLEAHVSQIKRMRDTYENKRKMWASIGRKVKTVLREADLTPRELEFLHTDVGAEVVPDEAAA